MKKFKYHFVYKITNDFDNRYYIGKHSTDNLDDNYFGSGRIITGLINKYGKEHFKKEIIKFFNTSLEAFKYEEYLVNENLLEDKNCINLQIGGRGSNINYDENFSIKQSLIHKGKITVKDKDNNCFQVFLNDERLKNGELVSVNKGLKRSEETKKKLSNLHKELGKNPTEKMKNAWKQNALNKIGKKLNLSEEGRQRKIEFNKKPKSKETKEKLSNKIYLCKLENNKEKYIFVDKELKDKYLQEGYKLGRFIFKRIFIYKNENNNIITKLIREDKLNNFINNGWNIGRGINTFGGLDNNGNMKSEIKEKHKNRCHIYKIINNNIQRKLIKLDFLDQYLNDGWIKGRILNKRRNK